MPELLLELGCEELPASFVAGSFAQLRDGVVSRLDAARLTHGEAEAYGTPRRLIVVVRDVIERQPDDTKEQRGPRIASAFDESGAPTKALEGFCRGQGVTPDDVRKEDDYVWVTKHIPGRPAAEVLAEILPEAIRALTFEKSMRWGVGGMRFARPIRWLLALFGGAIVHFEVEGVPSGNETRGHRFLGGNGERGTGEVGNRKSEIGNRHPELVEGRPSGPETRNPKPETPSATGVRLPISDFRSLAEGLRDTSVEFDPSRRKAMIVDRARALVPDGSVDATDDIVDENVYLTEWPMPSLGSFDASFLSLPSDVLVVAMKKHEKFLPVRDKDGKLTNRFISIRNAGDEETVIAGNEAVLESRFNDAKFFFDEDAKHPLSFFAERLDRVVFQEKLGTLKQKTERLVGLCESIARAVGLPEPEIALAKRAAALAKADLATGLVMELPALQGIVGGEYARRDGEPEEVCWAIRTHYNPEAPPDTLASKLARILMAADRIDTLVGYLGLGLVPSGSSDPFGLRRAMHMLILNGIAWGEKRPFTAIWPLAQEAIAGYNGQAPAFTPEDANFHLGALAKARYSALFQSIRPDLLDAVLGDGPPLGWDEPWKVRARMLVLHDAFGTDTFVDRARTGMRPINMRRAACRDLIAPIVNTAHLSASEILRRVDPTASDSVHESGLMEAATAVVAEATSAADRGDYAHLWSLLHDRLAKPIADFFDNVMVMVEDEKVRDNRLTLLSAIASMYLQIADFSKIVIEGE